MVNLSVSRDKVWVCFYDWDTGALVRRIDEVPKNVYIFLSLWLHEGLLE